MTFITEAPVTHICMIHYDDAKAKQVLENHGEVKLVIFNEDKPEDRVQYEALHAIYKDRVTMYEGDIKLGLDQYIKFKKEDGIVQPFQSIICETTLLQALM